MNDLPGKQNVGQEVMVQGSFVSVVGEVLLARGVPKKWIEVQSVAKKK